MAGERIDHDQTLRLTRTGALLDVDILLWPVRDRDGTIVGAGAIARDITEHTRARQEVTRLYEQQRHVALTLQHALMGAPREIPGLDSASRYLPATQGAGVGGDWFDLYTDGLIETHDRDIDEQITALEDVLRTILRSAPGLEQAADQILAALLPRTGQPPDDVTLLLTRTPAAPLASTATTLPPEPRSAAAARRFVAQTLTRWGHTAHVDTACLLVCEILTNAIHHARTPIGLRLHHNAREITAEITDDSTHLPQRRLAGPGDENGRGLMLVDALASSWGTRPAPTGKTVWFTLPADPI